MPYLMLKNGKSNLSTENNKSKSSPKKPDVVNYGNLKIKSLSNLHAPVYGITVMILLLIFLI